MRQAIVILEDNDERIAAMRDCVADKFPFFDVVVFRTAPATIAWLRAHLERAILISLDHDLEPSGEAKLGEQPGTGRDVVNCLLRRQPQCPVVIHSTNVTAAIAMEADLAESGWQVKRITPYDDLTWIAEAWLPRVRRSIVALAEASRPVNVSAPLAE